MIRLRLYGAVAAGLPMDAPRQPDEVDVPEELLMGIPGRLGAAQASGDSMVGEGIEDHAVLVYRTGAYHSGDLVIAATADDEHTVKRYWARHGQVELHAANPEHPVQTYRPEEVRVLGVVVLWRGKDGEWRRVEKM
jgi:repressor LexA